jgi:four helix bundle protein
MNNKIFFGHEKLTVYQKALEFIEWSDKICSRIHWNVNARNHLERASDSILFNIAEGNGKFTANDRYRFFDIAHGSALECSGCLDSLFARRKISEEELLLRKNQLKEIVSMLIGLIKSNSDRIYEPNEGYET